MASKKSQGLQKRLIRENNVVCSCLAYISLMNNINKSVRINIMMVLCNLSKTNHIQKNSKLEIALQTSFQ